MRLLYNLICNRTPSRRTILAGALATMALALSGCTKKWIWHQKVTVTVETPEGVKSASTVLSYVLEDTDGWYVLPEARGAGSGVRSGEAVVLEVAPGRYLFALLPGPNPFEVFFPGKAHVEVAPQFDTLREARVVPPKLYPRLVTFGDINDPASVQRIDPADLAASFGPGVRLKSITLEITDAPVSTGKVEAVLGWLGPYPEPALFPVAPYDFSFAAKLRQGQFILRGN